MTNPAHQKYIQAINKTLLVRRTGRVLQYCGFVVEASGPDAFVGEVCEIYTTNQAPPVKAEVVGFRDGKVILMPFGNLRGIYIGNEVVATGKEASVKVGDHLIGRVIDAFGKPLDSKPLEESLVSYPLYPLPTNPLLREPITDVFETGIKVIDTVLTIGKGQRVGIFAGSGVGKSSLLTSVTSNISCDINVVALIGERGREVVDFIVDLGPERLAKTILVVATADEHALVRTHAAYTATAIAEYFKDQGKSVMLAMDSITRFAMAQREIGLAIGEPPTVRGYTPSSFSSIPKLLERAGNYSGAGSITALYTVLVEGDDFNEPVSDNLRAILDGHIMLTRKLANEGQFPAVDVLNSVSRLTRAITNDSEQGMIKNAIRSLSVFEQSRDMIDVGAYQAGQNPELDKAISVTKKLKNFFAQKNDERVSRSESLKMLHKCLVP